jgi:integrase
VDVKTEAGIRRLGIVAPLRAELLEWKLASGGSGDSLIFAWDDGKPFVPSTARRCAMKAWTDAGLSKEGERIALRLHEGRHTPATDIDGASLSDKMAAHRMGHASVTITKDRYTHVTEAAILDATARLNDYYAERGSA